MKANMKRAVSPDRVFRRMFIAFTAAFLLAAFVAPDRGDMLTGLLRLLTGPAQLTKDYFKPELGGIAAALLNTALVAAIATALTCLPGAKVTGSTVLAWFLTVGFGTYGMNPLNMLPLVLGTLAWPAIRREPLGRSSNFALFATGLSPLVTQVLLYYPDMAAGPRLTLHGVILALAVGLAAGYAMPLLCAHSPAFHKGYNLYNAGPAAGFLCFALYALLYRTVGVEPPAIAAELGEGHPLFVNVFCAACFITCLAAGLLLDGGFRDYRRLLRESGYRTDFTEKYGAGTCLINLGVYGLFILLYYNLIGATFTGVTMGAVFCMVCCACAGATPRNVLPILLGYVAMGLMNRLGVTAFAVNAQGIVVGLCFASGLAPVAGEFGFWAGMAAAVLHYVLVTSVPGIHGGFNLYNGGFTAGIVCFVCVPVLERLVRRKPDSSGAAGSK